jgi:hypothetical protein
MKKLYAVDIRAVCTGAATVWAENEEEALTKVKHGDVDGIHLHDLESLEPITAGAKVQKTTKVSIKKVKVG